jgi:transposase
MMTSDNTPEPNLNTLPQWAQALIQQLTAQVHQLTAQVQELEGQLAKNSSSSGKPPGSDGLSKPNKTNSLRGKSGKKPGGQLGRKGTNLQPVQHPNKTIVHSPKTRTGCQTSLENVTAINVNKRQVFNIPLSPGTCANMDHKLYKNLEVFEENLKTHLLACKVLHLDETGVRCKKKLHWIHVTSSETATFFGLHAKRGSKAVNAMGILPQYRGNVVHDHWHCYFSYQQVKHGLCNVHHLRELKFVHEEENSSWAKEMTDLLLKGKGMVDKAKLEGRKALSQEEIRLIEDEYQRLILMIGHIYIDAATTAPPPEGIGKAGFNLFRRLLKRMGEVLYFAHDFAIPFSNNLAEQDLRMEKVKQKISGCFRTFEGGKISCRVRSYISTARKQGWNIIDALAEAVSGLPRLLSLPSTG